MKMKLIDLDYAIQEAEKIDIFDYCDVVGFVTNLSTTDPVHAAGGCYCKECVYSEYPTSTQLDCQLHEVTMPLNGFCSEGRKD